MKFQVSEIHWDIDDEYKEDYTIVKDEQAMIDEDHGEKLTLPESMIVEADDEDEAIDKCSDEYGWCIFNAVVKKI
jgi:hypothetical protein